MAKARKKAARKGAAKTGRKRILWTAADVKHLRKSAGRETVANISRTLRRSEAAVRYKATMLGISLASKRR